MPLKYALEMIKRSGTMKLRQMYELAVQCGIDADPRGRKAVEAELKKAKKCYDELKKDEREDFDKEALRNPYADTRILNGSGNENVKRILLGIDMEVGEVLLAYLLNQKGKNKIDLILAHHPEGRALAGLYSVMKMQEDIFRKFGVPINIAEGLMAKRIGEVERGVAPINHTRTEDAAKILGIPFACFHTVADNHVEAHLQNLFDKKKPETLGEIVKLLKEIPEYKDAIKHSTGPKIFVGSPERKAGKIFVNMTGGTEPAKEIYEKLSNNGVGTTVEMHISEEIKKEAEKHNISVVIAGHIASDNIGLNLLFDKIEKKGKLEVIPCSGFRRIRRK